MPCWQCSEHWCKAAHRLLAVRNHPELLGLLTCDLDHWRTAMSDSIPTLAWWWGLQARWGGAHFPPSPCATALAVFGRSPDLCHGVLRSLVREARGGVHLRIGYMLRGFQGTNDALKAITEWGRGRVAADETSEPYPPEGQHFVTL